MKRKICLIVTMVLVLSSCGMDGNFIKNYFSNENSNEESAIKNNKDDSDVKIKDIDWNISEGIYYGERTLMFEYENKSQYDISNIEVSLRIKNDLTEEQLSVLEKVKEDYKLDDDDISYYSIEGSCKKVVEPNTKSGLSHCYYDDPYKEFQDNDMLESDIIKFEYLKDGIIYSYYYDCISDKYTETSDNKRNAIEWYDTELSNKISKPNCKILEVYQHRNDLYMFDCYGVTYDGFIQYVNECKNQGFLNDDLEIENLFTASNDDGYNVKVSYDEDENSISVTIKK